MVAGLAEVSESAQMTYNVQTHSWVVFSGDDQSGLRAPGAFCRMLCALLSVQSGHRRLCISMGRLSQNTALTFRSVHFRCVVLLHSADEVSEKMVLRLTWFSEIMRILLIGWGRLQDVDTLTNSVCVDKHRSAVPCGLDVVFFVALAFCMLVKACFTFAHKQICAITWCCVS